MLVDIAMSGVLSILRQEEVIDNDGTSLEMVPYPVVCSRRVCAMVVAFALHVGSSIAVRPRGGDTHHSSVTLPPPSGGGGVCG